MKVNEYQLGLERVSSENEVKRVCNEADFVVVVISFRRTLQQAACAVSLVSVLLP